jgi:Na+/H+ antiporter NhaD/arsenite permease-like protein
MLCGVLGGLSYREHLLLAGPIALLGLGLNHAWITWMFRRELANVTLARTEAGLPFPVKALPAIGVTLGLALACIGGAPLAWAAIGAFALLLIIFRGESKGIWPRIDFSLLVFFSCLFILVETLRLSNAPSVLFEHFPLASLTHPYELATLFLVGSNLVSNVPFILVVTPELQTLDNPKLAWELLAICSTFAGNLSLLGSVANIIVAEAARDLGGIGFFPYLRVGMPLAILTTALAVLWLGIFFQPIAG